MVVTRQIKRGAQLASSTVGAPVHVHIRRVPYLLEPGYPEDTTFVETHQDRITRKFAATVGAKGKRTWDELDAKQREDLLAFLQTRKNCGDNNANLSLEERGKQVDISFLRNRINTSTVASHRLVRWASRAGAEKSEAVFAAVNSKHFEHGRRLNDHGMLAEAAADAGLSKEAALKYLSSDEDAQAVRDEAAHARMRMLKTVQTDAIPFVMFEEGGGTVQGAQSADVFANILEDIISRRR